MLYCNGMPVSVIELKKAGSATADVASAHAQLQTYLREFPMAFRFCVFTLASRRHPAPSTARRSRRSTTSHRGMSTTTACPSRPGHMDDGEAVTALETALDGPLQPGAVPAAAPQLHRL